MPSDRPTTAAALPLALVVCVLVVAGVAATPGMAVGKPVTVAAPRDPRRQRGGARPPPAYPAPESAGTPQRGLRPRHAGRSVRPADARRDSGLAAVAGDVPHGISRPR